jgi:hypothetical protein
MNLPKPDWADERAQELRARLTCNLSDQVRDTQTIAAALRTTRAEGRAELFAQSLKTKKSHQDECVCGDCLAVHFADKIIELREELDRVNSEAVMVRASGRAEGIEWAKAAALGVVLDARLDAALKRVETLEAALIGAAEVFEQAVRERGPSRGGQHVPYHGDFASMHPSSVRDLKRWAEVFRAALAQPDRGEMP